MEFDWNRYLSADGTKINISNLGLTQFPKGIENYPNIKILKCSANQLISLPIEIGHLTQLKEFNCCENQLTQLPDEIGLSGVQLKDKFIEECQEQKIDSGIFEEYLKEM